MTAFSNIKFDGKDIVKLIGFIGFVGSMWFDLKTDQVKAREERKFLQYQIEEIKMTAYFVKPEYPAVKTYRGPK